MEKTINNSLKKELNKLINTLTLNIVDVLSNKEKFNKNEALNYIKNVVYINNDVSNNDLSNNDLSNNDLSNNMSNNISNNIAKICDNYNIKKKYIYKTEDFGKKFEMAICLLYDTDYDGKFIYDLNEATFLKNRLFKLKDIIPGNLKHIASRGNPHDFKILHNDQTNTEISFNNTICDSNYLSAKTCKKGKNNNKKNGKVSPQIIGQPSKKKFCEYFKKYLNIDENYSIEEIKDFIIVNIDTLLHHYTINTFLSPIIYYNETRDILYYIKINKKIIWNKNDVSFTHIIKNKKWNESSSVKINNITIGEFQIHNNRNNIKFRWNFENLLKIYKDYFDILLL
jgi:hypothetical protein